MSIFIIHRVYDFSCGKERLKRQFWLFEYCYIMNWLLLIYYFVSVGRGISKENSYLAFRMFFSSCLGPLGISVAAFKNALVFHDIRQIIILSVHFSSNVAIWGMRWWPDKLEEYYPDTFNVGCSGNQFRLFYSKDDCAGTFRELYGIPIFVHFIVWCVPYYLFMFT